MTMNDTALNVAFLGSGFLLVALAIPLIRRKIPPNRLYGFRTPSTLNDERIWYEVNARTGVDLLVTGVGLLLLSLLHALNLFSVNTFVLASLACLSLGVLWSVIHGFAVIRRMKDARRRHGPRHLS